MTMEEEFGHRGHKDHKAEVAETWGQKDENPITAEYAEFAEN